MKFRSSRGSRTSAHRHRPRRNCNGIKIKYKKLFDELESMMNGNV